MENSYKFFSNKECEYYPCHRGIEEMNCLFCYCPMYSMVACPGNPSYMQSGDRRIKVCTNCTFPHVAGNYEEIIEILKTANAK